MFLSGLSMGLGAAPAYGVGVAGGVGVSVVDNVLEEEIDVTDDTEFSSESIIGPLLSVAMRGGDWVDHQLVVQFMSARGAISARHTTEDGDVETADGSVGFTTIGAGYQLGLDVFGKEGRHRLSPCVAVGFIVGSAGTRVRAHSDDPEVQNDLEEEGLTDQRDRVTFVTLHALAGLRVRATDDVGVRAVLGRSTTGALWMWQPQVVVDVTPRKGP